MPMRRLRDSGTRYFFTVATRDRRPILITKIERLRSAFREVLARRPFYVEAIVVLPDHLHAMWVMPEEDPDFSTRWMLLKRFFSHGLEATPGSDSQVAKREKGIWQRRFWDHAIRDDADWERHFDYIHYNPVKHGYCSRAAEWPYSSFRRMVGRGVYPADWGVSESEGAAQAASEAGIEGHR